MALCLGVVWMHQGDERFSAQGRGKQCAFYFNVFSGSYHSTKYPTGNLFIDFC